MRKNNTEKVLKVVENDPCEKTDCIPIIIPTCTRTSSNQYDRLNRKRRKYNKRSVVEE